MANISSAQGVFKFDPEFARRHKAVIQTWINKHAKAYYGFDLCDSALDDNGKISFYADGRWAYCHTLEGEGIGWTDYKKPKKNDEYYERRLSDWESCKAAKALGRALAKDHSVVTVEYTDYESGCCVLYKAVTELRYTSETKFETVEISYEEPEYTLRNIVENDCECSEFDFKKNTDDREKFFKEVAEKYSRPLEELGVDVKTFCNTVVKKVLEDGYRDGIVLEWEFYDFEFLFDISEITMKIAKVEWSVDIDEAYNKLDEMTVEAAAKVLTLPEEKYAAMTTTERHDYAYDCWRHNKSSVAEFVGLPEEVEYPDYIEDNDLAYYLSDRFGFCVENVLLVEELEKTA